jgi:CubicO group peptidase (beta-lactamase class C family)
MIRLLSLVAFLLCTCAAFAQPQRDFSKVEEAARQTVEVLGLPGAGLMIIEGDTVIYEKYFGTYDKYTKVALASATKWLSGATMVALEERGKLDLDDSVAKYVPAFNHGDHAKITLRQCFNHTSGLPGEAIQAERPRQSLEDAAAIIAKIDLKSAPGTEFMYGGLSMRLAGRCAEVAAGKPWRESFEELIARPLQMKETTYGRLELGSPNLGGGGQSTLPEYGRFVTMLLNDGMYGSVQVLSKESVKELIADKSGGVPIARRSAGWRSGKATSSYAVGCWVERKTEAGETITASSPGLFGFTPYINVEKKVGVIWMIEDREQQRKKQKGKLPDLRGAIGEAIGVELWSD